MRICSLIESKELSIKEYILNPWSLKKTAKSSGESTATSQRILSRSSKISVLISVQL